MTRVSSWVRAPLGAVERRDDPGVVLGEGDEVAVVIVPHVLVVDARQPRPLVGGAQVLPVVLHDHVHPVGVVARHHHQDDVVEPGEQVRILGGRHAVGEDR